jgi:hypothetical protein
MVTVPEIPKAKVGEPFHLAPSVIGLLGTVTWTVWSGDLPAGMNLDRFSGEVAGTPTMWGTTTAEIRATDSNRWEPDRMVSNTVTITVAPAPIQIAISALPGGVYHARYEATLSATGGTGSFKWSVPVGQLPPGLLVDASGLVAGEPQCIGSFAIGVVATDTKWPGYASSGTVSLDIVPTPFNVSASGVPTGVVGSPYSLSASATGQGGAITWSASGLPPGLMIDATGRVSGIPTAFGVFTSVLEAHDSYSTCGIAPANLTRTAEVSVTIAIAPLPLTITTTALPSGSVRLRYEAALQFAGGTGGTKWSVVDGQLPPGLTLSSAGVISGRPTAVGTFLVTVQASDAGWAGNIAARSFSITIRAREVVLYASDATTIAGAWSLVPDATAADGLRLWTPHKSEGEDDDEAEARPANYFEIPFQAEAGVAYHLWVRGKADKNRREHDGVIVQFSGSVGPTGAATYRIGTKSATELAIGDCESCRRLGWGWRDNRRRVNMTGPAIYFERSGAQTIRVRVEEDGFSVDQIVMSAEKFFTVAPGAMKNDSTIVPR